MQFSEAEGFAHLHVHLVPRMADLEERRYVTSEPDSGHREYFTDPRTAEGPRT